MDATQVAHLIQKLQSADVEDRCSAAEELARAGDEARPAAVALVSCCRDSDERVSECAAAALEEMGPPALEDLPRLAELLSSENADIAYWAATLLGRLEAGGARAVERLAATLRGNPHPQVQQRAAWALGMIRQSGSGAREALQHASESHDPRLARLAQQALQQISG